MCCTLLGAPGDRTWGNHMCPVVYTVHCTLYTVHCTLYILHLYIIQCTLFLTACTQLNSPMVHHLSWPTIFLFQAFLYLHKWNPLHLGPTYNCNIPTLTAPTYTFTVSNFDIFSAQYNPFPAILISRIIERITTSAYTSTFTAPSCIFSIPACNCTVPSRIYS